jgi:hypothetical protein
MSGLFGIDAFQKPQPNSDPAAKSPISLRDPSPSATPPNKKVAILQSNYIPWKGYFDIISAVDEFILFDDMQYTRRDWRNRNKIKTSQGLQWLTVPVEVKGKYHQSIRETLAVGKQWRDVHWKALKLNYSRSAHFFEISAWLEPLYMDSEEVSLSKMNRSFLEAICKYLGISTRITNSWDYTVVGGKTERLISLCKQSGAKEYISGPAARSYIEPKLFEESQIALSWFDYSSYREYPQQWGAFVHGVTILDLLFNCGPQSAQFMKCVQS